MRIDLTRAMGVAIAAIAIASSTRAAVAEPALRPQAQADLGLSVVGAQYEHPVAARVAIAVEAEIFGTYFLPWFDRGDDVKGVGVGARATWFARPSGHGLYVAPYVRGVGVRGTKAGVDGDGLGVTAGAFVGWSFALGDRFELRVGGGAQYIYYRATPLRASTPFVALDLVVGYRL